MGDDKRAKLWVGFDLGGTKMLAVVFNADMQQLGRQKRTTKAQSGVRNGLSRMVETLREALSEAKCDESALAGIGIGCPGPVDPDNGILLDPPNLGWKNVPIRDELQKTFKCPVLVANDVDAGVYGEYALGAARKARCVLGVFPGTGIGGGCVYEGRIFRGSERSCLEIGHMQVFPGGPRCGCGRRGCLEAVASRLAISAEAAKAVFRGQAPRLMERAGMNLADIRSGALAASIKEGDTAIELIVRDAARWLGVGIANVVNLIAPDCIVLGGGLVEAMPDLYLSEVEKTVRETAMSSLRKTFKLTIGKLGDDAIVMGAAAWARAAAGDNAK
jgi:glucokinase